MIQDTDLLLERSQLLFGILYYSFVVYSHDTRVIRFVIYNFSSET